MHGLSLVVKSRGYSPASVCGLLIAVASLVAEPSSVLQGVWTQELGCTGLVAHSMWNLPRPGTEPVSPALVGRFLSTLAPGKSCLFKSDYSKYLIEVKSYGIGPFMTGLFHLAYLPCYSYDVACVRISFLFKPA